MTSGPLTVLGLSVPQTSILKKAIQKKLFELDTLSDETLVDYVIVLLANKHEKGRIINELEDFLSPMVVDTFVDWIFVTVAQVREGGGSMNMEVPKSSKGRLFEVALRELPKKTFSSTMDTFTVASEPQEQSRGRRNRAERFGIREQRRSRSPLADGQQRMRTGRERRNRSRSPLFPKSGGRRSASPPRRQIIKYQSLSARRQNGSADGDERSVFKREEPFAPVRDARELISARRGVRRMEQDNTKDTGSSMTMDSGSSPAGDKRTRCTYWPNCKASDSCPFVHPTEACKHFPNCVFGDNCLFIHPAIPCKFQDKCQNPTCNYLHSSPAHLHGRAAGGSFSIANNPFHPPSAIACRFHPNCKNPSCPFMHPSTANCKFGENCQRPACPFAHPNNRMLVSKSIVNAPCRYGRNCAKPDCPFQHVTTPTTVETSDTMVASTSATMSDATPATVSTMIDAAPATTTA